MPRHVATCRTVRDFDIGNDAERTEGRDHFNHDCKRKRQAESHISYRQETSREPRPELTDRIGSRRSTAVAKRADRVAKYDCALFKARGFISARKICAKP